MLDNRRSRQGSVRQRGTAVAFSPDPMEGLTKKRQEVSGSDKKRHEVSRSVKGLFLCLLHSIYCLFAFYKV